MRVALILAAATWVACGGNEVSPEFSGTWGGTGSVIFADLGATSYEGLLSGRVSGGGVLFSGLCDGLSGQARADGGGDYVEWSGTIACPQAVAFADCSSVYMTYTSVRARLVRSGDVGARLEIQASGYGLGCNRSREAVLGFSGTRQ